MLFKRCVHYMFLGFCMSVVASKAMNWGFSGVPEVVLQYVVDIKERGGRINLDPGECPRSPSLNGEQQIDALVLATSEFKK